MDLKKHFKLYKAGRQWCVAGIATLAIATGMLVSTTKPVHADQQVPITGSLSIGKDEEILEN